MMHSKSKMDGGGAYGAGKAGAAFDPVEFIKRPQVICRIISWVFSIIVFGCISSVGYIKNDCIYNGDTNACHYGIGIGVVAFLGCVLFICVDAMFDNFSSVQQRKYIVIGDMVFSGFWTFLWFVGFCYLTDMWRKTTTDWLTDKGFHDYSTAQAAIAFSFFSIISWAGLAFLAIRRYQQGWDQAFAPSYEPDPQIPGASPYPAYPEPGQDPGYQQQPFQEPGSQPQPDYQAPAY
ncbi:synaptogyrin-3-like [Branchiostoma lanceolatum]|uniref:synaptogyrin-3-like n=1 Tax=Branchiostoma lanceolatum TaxID=7740 RepID=UPI003454D172